MRKELKSIDGKRIRFRAVVERFGKKTNYHGYPESTILFKNVTRTDTSKQVTDHIWFTVGKTIEVLELQPGDIVEFDARVGDYVKGYVNNREYIDDRTLDYKLNRPTRFERIGVGVSA
jgi:hypothetical protein